MVDSGVLLPGYTGGFKGAAPELITYESGGERWLADGDWKDSFTILK